ncbi:MAG: MFS transporter, partial [Hyphomicrobiales bacterium]|nr:MFS transporter [Hyphomicrobiales bacterium]
RLLTFSILLIATSFPGFYLIENLWLWFPLRAVFSIGLTGAFVLSEFWINDLAPTHRRGLIMGLYATVLSLGFATGPAILSLVGSDGILPFIIGTAIILASAIPGLLARRDEPVLSEPQRMPFAAFIIAVPMATFGVAVFGAAESSIFALLPIYALELGYDETMAVLFSAIVPIGNMTLLLPLGILADRMDRRRLLLAIGLVGALGAVTLPLFSGNAIAFGTALFIWGGIIAGLYTIGLTHLASRFTGSDLAAANAAFVLIDAVGMAFGPAAVGGGIDLLPPHGFAFVLAAFFAGYLALALWRMVMRADG